MAYLCVFLSDQPPRRQSHANKSDHSSTAESPRNQRHTHGNGTHRTRLHGLDQEIISVLNFYKTSRRAAPRLWSWEHTQTEKIEKNFMLFQFSDRAVLRVKVTIN
ncbi:hypothetical protein BSR02_19920 [Serratia liquefaciens]|nr:hypothetical protein BSR02_19920 [Serratia liquefaciens]